MFRKFSWTQLLTDGAIVWDRLLSLVDVCRIEMEAYKDVESSLVMDFEIGSKKKKIELRG